MAYQIRSMLRQDFYQILLIEEFNFARPWNLRDLEDAARERHAYCLVAESNDIVLGYVVYKVLGHDIRLRRISVHPDHQGHGVGASLASTLIAKLRFPAPASISLNVRETNLAAQLFYRRMGFAATEVKRGHYVDTGEDAYAMKYYLLGGPSAWTDPTEIYSTGEAS
ncbi:ribosomal protein S18-alanine N-acetyltransferase [Singulisphaera sp. PoT]|uniref:ribosomal protein S18-alanine N-acetyltransferase n=1 Tax=Singulisphaera sp. PoT TaxID=3411797 RepID=UPI003BF527FC